MQTIKDISYSSGNDKMQKLDIYLPDKEEFAVIVYFHGGGIVDGDKECVFCPYLQENGVGVVSANYRMYPAVKFPEFLEDAAEAVAWAVKNISSYGKVIKIYVGGSSAGAYISQMLCFDKRYLGKHGIDPDSLAGFFFDAGQPTVHFNVLKEKGIDPKRVVIDENSPLFHACSERNYPRMHFIVSDNDLPGRYEQTMLFLVTLKNLGHGEKTNLKVMENSSHCSYTDVVIDGRNPLADMIAEFIGA